MRSCTLRLQLKQQQFLVVSVLRLFRGLGLRGVQILAAGFLVRKGFFGMHQISSETPEIPHHGETTGLTEAPDTQLTAQTRILPSLSKPYPYQNSAAL